MARRRSKARVSAAHTKKRERRFVICVRNDANPAALKLQQTYEVIPDGKAAEHHLLRVVDELGEDYLYPESCFAPLKKPKR